jgi:hypothetical protein
MKASITVEGILVAPAQSRVQMWQWWSQMWQGCAQSRCGCGRCVVSQRCGVRSYGLCLVLPGAHAHAVRTIDYNPNRSSYHARTRMHTHAHTCTLTHTHSPWHARTRMAVRGCNQRLQAVRRRYRRRRPAGRCRVLTALCGTLRYSAVLCGTLRYSAVLWDSEGGRLQLKLWDLRAHKAPLAAHVPHSHWIWAAR